MGINISDIIHVIKFMIPNFIAIAELLQQLYQKSRDKSRTTITIVFVHSSQVLLNNMHMLEQSVFKNLLLHVNIENREQITDVII